MVKAMKSKETVKKEKPAANSTMKSTKKGGMKKPMKKGGMKKSTKKKKSMRSTKKLMKTPMKKSMKKSMKKKKKKTYKLSPPTHPPASFTSVPPQPAGRFQGITVKQKGKSIFLSNGARFKGVHLPQLYIYENAYMRHGFPTSSQHAAYREAFEIYHRRKNIGGGKGLFLNGGDPLYDSDKGISLEYLGNKKPPEEGFALSVYVWCERGQNFVARATPSLLFGADCWHEAVKISREELAIEDGGYVCGRVGAKKRGGRKLLKRAKKYYGMSVKENKKKEAKERLKEAKAIRKKTRQEKRDKKIIEKGEEEETNQDETVKAPLSDTTDNGNDRKRQGIGLSNTPKRISLPTEQNIQLPKDESSAGPEQNQKLRPKSAAPKDESSAEPEQNQKLRPESAAPKRKSMPKAQYIQLPKDESSAGPEQNQKLRPKSAASKDESSAGPEQNQKLRPKSAAPKRKSMPKAQNGQSPKDESSAGPEQIQKLIPESAANSTSISLSPATQDDVNSKETMYEMSEMLIKDGYHYLSPGEGEMMKKFLKKKDESSSMGTPLIKVGNISLTREDFKTLRHESGKLKDDILNVYLSLVVKKANEKNEKKVVALDTQFWTNLALCKDSKKSTVEYNYENVREWTSSKRHRKGIDIFSQDLVIIPMNTMKGEHWTIVAIDIPNRTYVHYCSLGNSPRKHVRKFLNRYLADEHRDKKGTSLKGEWRREKDDKYRELTQENDYDCGVFAAYVARRIALEENEEVPSFDSKKTYERRILMSFELKNQELRDPKDFPCLSKNPNETKIEVPRYNETSPMSDRITGGNNTPKERSSNSQPRTEEASPESSGATGKGNASPAWSLTETWDLTVDNDDE